jgi:hypothetical protein
MKISPEFVNSGFKLMTIASLTPRISMTQLLTREVTPHPATMNSVGDGMGIANVPSPHTLGRGGRY